MDKNKLCKEGASCNVFTLRCMIREMHFQATLSSEDFAADVALEALGSVNLLDMGRESTFVREHGVTRQALVIRSRQTGNRHHGCISDGDVTDTRN